MATRIGIEAQRLFRVHKHGVEVVCLELLRELQSLPSANEYFVFVKDDKDVCLTTANNCNVIVLPSMPYPLWEQFVLPNAIRKYRLQLLHCTGNTAPIHVSVPRLLTLHDIIFLEDRSFSGTAYQNWGNLYRRWVVPRIVPKCRSIVTVSQFEKERIMEYFHLADHQVEVVYNGVNSDFKSYAPGELAGYAKKYNLPAQFILFFGNPNPKKNTVGVLKAYNRYYNEMKKYALPLVVVDCSEAYINSMLRKFGLQNMERNILPRNYIPFREMPYLYNLATLFLYPSQREAFGLPILESMACGTPVITATNSSMPEVAGGAALLVDAGDEDEMAERMQQVLSDSSLYRQKKEEGITRAATFSWKETTMKMIKVYEKAMG